MYDVIVRGRVKTDTYRAVVFRANHIHVVMRISAIN